MDQASKLRGLILNESLRVYKNRQEDKRGLSLQRSTPKVIAITSGKGGVGKTNVVGNLAIACQRLKKKVLIFDADLGLANIDIIYGINPKHNIEDVIKGEKGLSQIIVEGPEGVSLIPASSGVQELVHLSEGHKINLLNEFDILNNMFDLLLVDTGAGISSNVIYFNLAAEERIIVATPEPTSITDAYALMKVMFYQHGTKNFTLLINMARDEKEAKSVYQNMSKAVEKFMGSISLDYAGFIPWDNMLQKAVAKRKPVICSYPDAPASANFNKLARYLFRKSDKRPMDGNIKFFWKRLVSVTKD